jgi:hypothetical protein
LTDYNTSSQSKALDSIWKALGFEGSKKRDGEDDEKSSFFRAFPEPSIYRAKWMRKPGDPDYEEDEGETAGGWETSTRREPVMGNPEPPPRSARPAAESQSPTVRPGGNPVNRSIETTESPRWKSGEGIGRDRHSLMVAI